MWSRASVCLSVHPMLSRRRLCQPVSSVPGRRQLRSARRGELDFPRANLATYGARAFAYAGPTSWNSLPDRLDRDLWDVNSGGSKESYIK